MVDLGNKIKELRDGAGFDAKDFSEKIGLKPDQLEMIEKGQEQPTVATLMRISSTLGISMGIFFKEKETKNLYELTRAMDIEMQYAESHEGHHTTYRYANLMPNSIDRDLEPFIAEFPFLDPKNIPLDSHLGHEFIFILQGKLVLEIAKEKIELQKGDSLYFESSYPHRYIPKGDIVPKVICILMPPKEK